MTLEPTKFSQNPRSQTTDSVETRRVLWIAYVLNATMFSIDVGAGLIARSSGLLADGIDMFERRCRLRAFADGGEPLARVQALQGGLANPE